MNRKSQGLSINTIIIAAIALIVLVVLVAIFTGRLGLFSKGLGETTTCDQICKARGIDANKCGAGSGENGESAPAGLTKQLLGARDGEGKQCWYAE